MKKLLALIFAAALALSLVACGGDSGAGDTNTPSGGNGDITGTDTPSGETGSTPDNEKESLLSSASEFSGQEFITALNNNPLKAKQDRIGNAYIFTGFFIVKLCSVSASVYAFAYTISPFSKYSPELPFQE